MSGNDDPLAGLLGSARRQKKKKSADLSFGKRDKPAGETGLNPLDLLALPTDQRDTINWLSRRKQATLQQLQEALNKKPDEVAAVIAELKKVGYVREALIDGAIYYRVVFGGKVSRSGRGVPQNIWNAVDLDNQVFLRQLPLFKHLDDEALQSLAEKLETRHFHRNEVIAWQGDIEQDLLFIKNGIVGIQRLLPGSSEEGHILAYLKQGDMLGETTLLLEQNVASDTTATALSEVDVLVMKRNEFVKFLNANRQAALELAREILQRLLNTNSRLVSVGSETKVACVFGIGKQCGQTMVGSSLAMTLSHVTQGKAVYTEHPNPEALTKLFNIKPDETFHPQSGLYDIAIVKTAPGLPMAVRTTLVMDQLLAEYANVVIGFPSQVDETVNYILEQANQLIIVVSPDEKALDELEKLIEQLRAVMHPEKTNLFVVANHTQPGLSIDRLPVRVDYEIPYFGNEVTVWDTTQLADLPSAVSKVTDMLADRLGRTNQVGIYIPSSIDDPDVNVNDFVQESLSFLGSLFGGATATTTEAQGSGDDINTETIHIVRTYVTKSAMDRELSKVLEFVEQLKNRLGQDALALEVNAKLMLI